MGTGTAILTWKVAGLLLFQYLRINHLLNAILGVAQIDVCDLGSIDHIRLRTGIGKIALDRVRVLRILEQIRHQWLFAEYFRIFHVLLSLFGYLLENELQMILLEVHLSRVQLVCFTLLIGLHIARELVLVDLFVGAGVLYIVFSLRVV